MPVSPPGTYLTLSLRNLGYVAFLKLIHHGKSDNTEPVSVLSKLIC